MTSLLPLIADADGVVAVRKPPGLPVVPGTGHDVGDCVRGRLELELGARLWVVHRLDRDTSGVLLFARTPEVHRALCLAFEERRVRKTYVAVTLGVPSPPEGRITTALHPARRGKVRPALAGEAGAWDAATTYVVRGRWHLPGTEAAMVDMYPETGRHHQIRAHLRSIGTPILFDRVYGKPAAAFAGAPSQRLALHASKLVVLEAGQTGLARTFEAPLPDDLTALLRWLDVTSSPG